MHNPCFHSFRVHCKSWPIVILVLQLEFGRIGLHVFGDRLVHKVPASNQQGNFTYLFWFCRFRMMSNQLKSKSNTCPATVVMTAASSLPKSLRYHIKIFDISTALLSSVSRTCKVAFSMAKMLHQRDWALFQPHSSPNATDRLAVLVYYIQYAKANAHPRNTLNLMKVGQSKWDDIKILGCPVGHLISNSEPSGTQVIFSTELFLIPHKLDEFYKSALCSHKTKLDIGRYATI